MSSLTDIANAVKGEYPGYHQATIIEQMFKDGIEMHRDMSPFRSAVDFVGTEVRMASINIWSVEEVAAIDFMLKWNVGMPRPEEVVWLIANGGFTTENDDIPADIVTLIKSMNLSHAAEFTAYEDGSPMHPSYPAMHSAASTCSYWIPAICKITPDQYCEALRVDYATSYARTVAGVHYRMVSFIMFVFVHDVLSLIYTRRTRQLCSARRQTYFCSHTYVFLPVFFIHSFIYFCH